MVITAQQAGAQADLEGALRQAQASLVEKKEESSSEKETAASAKEQETGKDYPVSVTFDEETIGEILGSFADGIDCDPVDATIKAFNASTGSFSYTEGKTGRKVDREKLQQLVVKALQDGESTEIEAPVEEIPFEKTQSDISGHIQKLGSFSTYSTNTAAGNNNMRLALASINGKVVEPGATFSFNGATGDTTNGSLGYQKAGAIVNGKSSQQYGGGICQASTVIYQAALKANLGVYERYCHYYKSSYADVGLDATIDYPSLDLKLQNNTDHPVYLQCYMDGATLYASFYGWQDPSFAELKLSSWIYEENYAANYYRAAAQRTFYKDGKELYSESLPNSEYGYYSPKPDKPTKPTKPTVATKPATTPEVPTDAPITTPPEPSEYPTTPVTPTTPDPTIIDSGTDAS